MASTGRPAPIATVPSLPPTIMRVVEHGGYLESARLGLCIAGLTGSVLLGVLAEGFVNRRPRRLKGHGVASHLRRATTGLVVMAMGASAAGVLINSHVGYAPTLTSLIRGPAALPVRLGIPVTASRSAIVHLDIPAPNEGVAHGSTYVYLPRGYVTGARSGHRYPVVYLLHGTPGRAADWFTAGELRRTMDVLVADHYLGPMIVVSPTSSTDYFADDECLNSTPRPQLETYLSVTVVDRIDRQFATAPVRSERAIGGMSSGAFCALNIGLHHLSTFSTILAAEPYGTPGRHALAHLLHGSLTAYDADSPARYLPRMTFPFPVAVFLNAGTRDPSAVHAAQEIAAELSRAGQYAALRLAPGQRDTWRTARSALPYSLIFAWQHIQPAAPAD